MRRHGNITLLKTISSRARRQRRESENCAPDNPSLEILEALERRIIAKRLEVETEMKKRGLRLGTYLIVCRQCGKESGLEKQLLCGKGWLFQEDGTALCKRCTISAEISETRTVASKRSTEGGV